MKKWIISLVFLGGLIFLGTGLASAIESDQDPVKTAQTAGSGFVDANGDGICDNYDGIRPGKGKGPGNGQGLGRADGKGLGKGKGQQLRNGSGAGNGMRLRDGSGGNCPAPAK